MDLKQYLKSNGYVTVDDGYIRLVDKWEQWYKGNVIKFHNYTIYTGENNVAMKRASLNMAKQGAEYWANLLWNNECFVTLEDETAQKYLDAVLLANDFSRQTNILTEKAFALGTGAYVVFSTPAGPKIDYVAAGCIYPLEWYNDDCQSCAFATVTSNQDGTKTLYLMIHLLQPSKAYKIYNKFFNIGQDGTSLEEIPPPKGVSPEYAASQKRFALLRPNIANNAYNIPMGVSVYANSIDVLKSIDLAFDGINVSMQLGRPRIAVSTATVKPSLEGMKPVFDTNDVAFYVLPESDAPRERKLVEDITITYQAEKFEKSLQNALTLYSQQIGLGEKAFRWDTDARTSVTATQVIAENGAMLRTMEKHQEGLRSAITDVVKAIFDVAGMAYKGEIKVTFDDSATRDKDAERMRAWQYVVAGKFPFWRYLVDFEGYSEEDAKKIEAEAAGAPETEAGEE